MLNKDHTQRITLDEAQKHPWLSKWNKEDPEKDLSDAYLSRLQDY